MFRKVAARARRGGGGPSAAARQPCSPAVPRFRIGHLSTRNAQLRAKAVDLCNDGDAIILNGGTTTFQMVHYMAARRLQVMNQFFRHAEHLVKHSKCSVSVPGGAIYRDQSLILSPFENERSAIFMRGGYFSVRKVSARSALGIRRAGDPERTEADAAAEELIVNGRFPEIQKTVQPDFMPARNVTTIITDDGIQTRRQGWWKMRRRTADCRCRGKNIRPTGWRRILLSVA